MARDLFADLCHIYTHLPGRISEKPQGLVCIRGYPSMHYSSTIVRSAPLCFPKTNNDPIFRLIRSSTLSFALYSRAAYKRVKCLISMFLLKELDLRISGQLSFRCGNITKILVSRHLFLRGCCVDVRCANLPVF